MGDPTKFRYLWEYYSFHVVFACLLLSELFIFFYPMQRGTRTQTAKCDHGTKWLLYGNFAVCLFIIIYSVSQAAPVLLRNLVFPPFVADIGAAFVAAGMELQELHAYIQEHQPNICQTTVLRDGNESYSAEWNSYQRMDCV